MAETTIPSQSWLARGNALLQRWPWAPYLFLTLWYVLINFPDQILVRNFGAIAFPLESMVITKLLFAGHAVRPELAATLAEPSNAALIYPPGLYVLVALLGTVQRMFLFLFVVQAVVPALLYRLFKTVSTPVLALLVAILGSYYFIKTSWWTPDFIIQPLSILVLMLLGVGGIFKENSRRNLVMAGLVTGLILVLKHNIGIFFAITCGTWVFLSNFVLAGEPGSQNASPRLSRWATWLGLAGFAAFGLIFARRTIHWDERIFYLLPYALFWLGFYWAAARACPAFRIGQFLHDALFFGSTALLLPLFVFIKFGEVFGYGRYWFSLTGMGFKYLGLWDLGILSVIGKSVSFAGPATIYQSLITALLYLTPLLAGLCVVITLLRTVRTASGRPTFDLLRYGAIAIMATFMLFPLESLHILETKLFLFLLPVFLILGRQNLRIQTVAACVLAIAALPVMAYGLAKPVGVLRTPSTMGNKDMAKTIALPLAQSEAANLAGQLAVLRRTVAGKSYYVVDSSGGTLVGLAAMIESPAPQYYVEMRDGIMDQAVTDRVLAEIAQRPYVVVNSDDYGRHARGEITDLQLQQVMAYVDGHFTVTDEYHSPQQTGPDNHILSFKVFRKKD
jgi:hypothetical protein